MKAESKDSMGHSPLTRLEDDEDLNSDVGGRWPWGLGNTEGVNSSGQLVGEV